MKIFISFCILIVVTSANVADNWDSQNHFHSTFYRHNEQHQQSVDAAREELQRKLSAIGGGKSQYHRQAGLGEIGNSYSSSGSERYSALGSNNGGVACTYCSNSDSRHSASSQRLQNSDYVGVGTVGHVDSRYHDQDAESFQTVVKPTFTRDSASSSSRYSGSSTRYSSSADSVQETVTPKLLDGDVDLSSVSAAAYRQGLSNQNEEDLQRTVSSGYQPVYGGSRVYSERAQQSQSERESSRTVSSGAPVYGQNQGSSRNYLSASRVDADENDEQVRVQGNNRIGITVRPGQPVKFTYVPNQGYQSGSLSSSSSSAHESNSQSSQSSYPSSQTYRVVYTPVYTPVRNVQSSSQTNSESERTSTRPNGVQRPEKLTNYDKFYTHSRAQNEEVEDTQQRVAPVSHPNYGGNSRYSSQSQSQQQSSSSRYGSSRPVSNTIINNNRASDSEYAASTHHQRQNIASSSYQQRQNQNAGTFSPYAPSRSSQQISNSQQVSNLNNRFSSSITDHSDLKDYMTEAERLAAAQQQQVVTSSSSDRFVANNHEEANRRTYDRAADLDSLAAKFVSTNMGNRNNIDLSNADLNNAGGFQNVRSWSRQSKWASGSEYGSDGKPKTYSSMSTGESEKYNINGEEAGYKAATSTLEKDGKVSTYSIHT